jgi:hypothetical protein
MSKWVIDMPDGWEPKLGRLNMMLDCPINTCDETDCRDCPFSNAKKAVELNAYSIGLYGYGTGNECFDGEGKPVKLWATEEE